MLRSDLPTPLYQQIKDYILAQIETGKLPPNSRLPSERDLAEQFGVSRLTVNKAIKELVQAGWLHVQIGKGTYIKELPITQEITALTSLSEEMSLRGKSTSSKVLHAGIVPASEDTARALQMVTPVDVVLLKRVRYAAGRPIAIEEAALIASSCPGILDRHDFSRESLYHVLQSDYGIYLTHADQSFEARAATAAEAQHLAVRVGAPVLQIQRTTYTGDDRPFEVVNSVYRGDRYKFRARLQRIPLTGADRPDV